MPRSTLFSLDFAICELRKALIYKGLMRVSKTPKAVLEGREGPKRGAGIQRHA
ncbi:hypothetical protein Y024_5785 [Burkholderia pseudomallei TSV44]|nr:hypothetical protein Y024_5785 [Burkholderia pseudomallei TSV44]